MDYHQNLKNATTVKEVQKFYNEGFKRHGGKRLKKKFISEGRGQQLVYADGYIDPIFNYS